MIYLDHHASTPCHKEVVSAMLPYFTEKFGNPHSKDHEMGWQADAAIETAREQIATALGAKPHEIFFTSGATEANNMAIKGGANWGKKLGRHRLVSGVAEHSCVRESLLNMQKQGFEVVFIPIQRDGKIDLDEYRSAVNEDTALVTIMAANNEIGTIHPIQELAEIAHDKGAYFHSDAAQFFTKNDFNVKDYGVDMASFSAHKLYGPKGVGALYINQTKFNNLPLIQLSPLLHGGGQERGLRSGTLATPLIVGFGKAVEMEMQTMAKNMRELEQLRDYLWDLLSQGLGNQISLNGAMDNRLPNNLHINLYGFEADAFFALTPDICVSTGSACRASGNKRSHVMQALGHDPATSMTSLRFGLGHTNSKQDIETVANRIIQSVKQLNSS